MSRRCATRQIPRCGSVRCENRIAGWKIQSDVHGCLFHGHAENGRSKKGCCGSHGGDDDRCRTETLLQHVPDRCFDVGIAEEHAVTFAAALSLGGITPVVAIYSSFLQRAYDQIMHDVCMQNLHVVFAIDRAGLVGYDGETHHGIFDLSYLGSMPNMTILAPKNLWELSDMIKFAVDYDGPIAVRYPRGEAYTGLKEFRAPICLGKSEVIHEEAVLHFLPSAVW